MKRTHEREKKKKRKSKRGKMSKDKIAKDMHASTAKMAAKSEFSPIKRKSSKKKKKKKEHRKAKEKMTPKEKRTTKHKRTPREESNIPSPLKIPIDESTSREWESNIPTDESTAKRHKRTNAQTEELYTEQQYSSAPPTTPSPKINTSPTAFLSPHDYFKHQIKTEADSGNAIKLAEYNDGDQVVRFMDGGKMHLKKTGYFLRRYPNGATLQRNPDGKIIKVDVDGTRTQISTNGNQVISAKCGSRITAFPSGQRIFAYPDGTRKQVNVDGSVITVTPNGSHSSHFLKKPSSLPKRFAIMKERHRAFKAAKKRAKREKKRRTSQPLNQRLNQRMAMELAFKLARAKAAKEAAHADRVISGNVSRKPTNNDINNKHDAAEPRVHVAKPRPAHTPVNQQTDNSLTNEVDMEQIEMEAKTEAIELEAQTNAMELETETNAMELEVKTETGAIEVEVKTETEEIELEVKTETGAIEVEVKTETDEIVHELNEGNDVATVCIESYMDAIKQMLSAQEDNSAKETAEQLGSDETIEMEAALTEGTVGLAEWPEEEIARVELGAVSADEPGKLVVEKTPGMDKDECTSDHAAKFPLPPVRPFGEASNEEPLRELNTSAMEMNLIQQPEDEVVTKLATVNAKLAIEEVGGITFEHGSTDPTQIISVNEAFTEEIAGAEPVNVATDKLAVETMAEEDEEDLSIEATLPLTPLIISEVSNEEISQELVNSIKVKPAMDDVGTLAIEPALKEYTPTNSINEAFTEEIARGEPANVATEKLAVETMAEDEEDLSIEATLPPTPLIISEVSNEEISQELTKSIQTKSAEEVGGFTIEPASTEPSTEWAEEEIARVELGAVSADEPGKLVVEKTPGTGKDELAIEHEAKVTVQLTPLGEASNEETLHKLTNDVKVKPTMEDVRRLTIEPASQERTQTKLINESLTEQIAGDEPTEVAMDDPDKLVLEKTSGEDKGNLAAQHTAKESVTGKKTVTPTITIGTLSAADPAMSQALYLLRNSEILPSGKPRFKNELDLKLDAAECLSVLPSNLPEQNVRAQLMYKALFALTHVVLKQKEQSTKEVNELRQQLRVFERERQIICQIASSSNRKLSFSSSVSDNTHEDD